MWSCLHTLQGLHDMPMLYYNTLHSTLPVVAVLVAITVTDCALMFCRCVPTALWQETQCCAQSSSSLSSPGYHKYSYMYMLLHFTWAMPGCPRCNSSSRCLKFLRDNYTIFPHQTISLCGEFLWFELIRQPRWSFFSDIQVHLTQKGVLYIVSLFWVAWL